MSAFGPKADIRLRVRPVYITSRRESRFRWMGKLGKVAIWTGLAVIVLAAIPVVAIWRRHSPTHDDVQLKAINAEARTLMARGPTRDWRGVPQNRWPATIANLKPEWVKVNNWGVEVEIESYFDGGWGYDVVPNGAKPPMPIQCYRSLGRGIYWHDPC